MRSHKSHPFLVPVSSFEQCAIFELEWGKDASPTMKICQQIDSRWHDKRGSRTSAMTIPNFKICDNDIYWCHYQCAFDRHGPIKVNFKREENSTATVKRSFQLQRYYRKVFSYIEVWVLGWGLSSRLKCLPWKHEDRNINYHFQLSAWTAGYSSLPITVPPGVGNCNAQPKLASMTIHNGNLCISLRDPAATAKIEELWRAINSIQTFILCGMHTQQWMPLDAHTTYIHEKEKMKSIASIQVLNFTETFISVAWIVQD